MHLSLVILGAGILPPGKAALLVPRFLPLFLPSLSPRSLAPLPRPTFPFVTVSPPSLISFHFPFFFRFSRIAYTSFFQRGVASRCYPCFPVSSSSSILLFRFDEATITRPLVPLPPPNFAGLVDFRASPFAFLPTPPPFSPSSIHPSIPLSIRAVPFFKVSHLPRQSHFLPDFANPSVSKNRGFEFPRIVFSSLPSPTASFSRYCLLSFFSPAVSISCSDSSHLGIFLSSSSFSFSSLVSFEFIHLHSASSSRPSDKLSSLAASF